MDQESGQIEIPEHEVTTRRKQFRMKRAKRDEKKQKKDAKKTDLEKKQQEKMKKKADKEKKKADKAKEKEQEKLRKKKEKETKKEAKKHEKKEKTSGAKTKKGCGKKRAVEAKDEDSKRSSKKRCLEEETHAEEENQQETPMNQPPASPVLDSTPGAETNKDDGQNEIGEVTFEPSKSPVSPESKSPPGIGSRGFKKLRQLKNANFGGIVHATGEPDEVEGKNTSPVEMDEVGQEHGKGQGEDENKKKAGSRKATKKDSKKTSESKTSRKKQQENKAAKKKQAEKKTGKTKTSKTANPKKEAKPKRDRKSRAGTPVEITEVDETIKQQVMKVLHECKATNCCHPTFEKAKIPKNAAVQLSTYWTRCAVGVKIRKPNKKFGQVAYFAQPTICTYSNLLTAGIYVTCPKTDVYNFRLSGRMTPIYTSLHDMSRSP